MDKSGMRALVVADRYLTALGLALEAGLLPWEWEFSRPEWLVTGATELPVGCVRLTVSRREHMTGWELCPQVEVSCLD